MAAKRQYVSPLRRQQTAETRERILSAGCELLRSSSIRDWRAVTIRGVAEEAGVNERTVYRHFGNERGLRDAVMSRLEEEAGVDLTGMRLQDIPEVAARIFTHVSAYPLPPKPPLDPTLNDANLRQRQALSKAIGECAAQWAPGERLAAAAMFDVLWSVSTFERLVAEWDLDLNDAIRTVGWAARLVAVAVRDGRSPLRS